MAPARRNGRRMPGRRLRLAMPGRTSPDSASQKKAFPAGTVMRAQRPRPRRQRTKRFDGGQQRTAEFLAVDFKHALIRFRHELHPGRLVPRAHRR